MADIKTGHEISFEKLMAIMESMKEGNWYAFFLHYIGDEKFKHLMKRYHSSPEQSHRDMTNIKEVFAILEALYQQGADPSGKEGQELAKRWWNMVTEITVDDPGLLKQLISAGMDIENWPEVQTKLRPFLDQLH